MPFGVEQLDNYVFTFSRTPPAVRSICSARRIYDSYQILPLSPMRRCIRGQTYHMQTITQQTQSHYSLPAPGGYGLSQDEEKYRSRRHGVALALARVAPPPGHRPGSGKRSHGDGSSAGNTRST